MTLSKKMVCVKLKNYQKNKLLDKNLEPTKKKGNQIPIWVLMGRLFLNLVSILVFS